MSQTIEALFDGEVLRPDESLNLRPNTRVRITIDESTIAKPQSFLCTARLLNLQGSPNWSEQLEEDLYGKQTNAQN